MTPLALDDLKLLEWFAAEQAQAAFAELVRRHLDMVYATALRRVGGDRQLAEDVAQRVFADLARKAGSLDRQTMLAGWLHRGARFAAAQVVRTERRRKLHEQEAMAMNELTAAAAIDWDRLRPLIDDAMEELNDTEREVLLLRFFEHRPLAEVGARFAVSADAARMRVDRALDKLRGQLARRGIVSTSAALAATFASQVGVAAPAGLAGAVMAGVFGAAGVVAGAAGAAALTAAAGSTAATAAPLAVGKILAGGVIGAVAVGWVALAVLRPASERGSTATVSAGPAAPRSAAGAGPVKPVTPAVTAIPVRESKAGEAGKGRRKNLNVETFTERLDRLVALTAEQKEKARALFIRQDEALNVFASPDERVEQGDDIRQETRTAIRALLTPAQQKIYDLSPRRLGGDAMQDAASVAEGMDKVVALTDEQTLQVAALYQHQIEALQTLSPAGRAGDPAREIRRATRDQLRALLTPEQQVKFDANPNGLEDLDERAKVAQLLQESRVIAARIGPVNRLMLVDAEITTLTVNEQAPTKRGSYTFAASGRDAQETYTVQWRRASATAPVTVVKIETAQGEVVGP